MVYSLIFQNIYPSAQYDQIRVISRSVTSDIYNFFVLGTFKVFSTSYFEIFG
jgi:hypothetical protein